MLRGSIAAGRRHWDESAVRFEEAERRYAALDMSLYAAACRRRFGEVIAGGRGDAMVREANAVFEAQGVRDTTKFVAIFAPPIRR
jgi:hypothetical protein